MSKTYRKEHDMMCGAIDTIYNFTVEHLEVIGAVVGLVYLWLEYRASIHLWIAGVVMPAIYLFVYYDAGLYADCAISIYYLAAALYGWIVWHFGRRTDSATDDGKAIQSLFSGSSARTWRRIATLALVAAVLFVAIAWLLIGFTDSTVPWLDSFTTALSVIAMWLLARKYTEQWLVWIAVDVVSAGLYLYKELPFTAALYMLYAVIAMFGYRKWTKMMKHNAV